MYNNMLRYSDAAVWSFVNVQMILFCLWLTIQNKILVSKAQSKFSNEIHILMIQAIGIKATKQRSSAFQPWT